MRQRGEEIRRMTLVLMSVFGLAGWRGPSHDACAQAIPSPAAAKQDSKNAQSSAPQDEKINAKESGKSEPTRVDVKEEKWPDGTPKLRSEGRIDENGEFVRHGTTVEWHKNGQKKSERHFREGIQQGTHETWHDNGQLSAKGAYMEGVEDGIWTVWYSNGHKQREWTLVRGSFQGPFTEWYANGKKKSEVQYVAGKRQGPMLVWDEDGSLQLKTDYVDGVEQP